MVGSFIEAHSFGNMEVDEECNCDHTLVIIQNYNVEEDNSKCARMLS